MEGNLGDSEGRPAREPEAMPRPSDQESAETFRPSDQGSAETPRPTGIWRTVAIWGVGLGAVLLLLWGISTAIERMAVPTSKGESISAQAGPAMPDRSNTRVVVRVIDEKGVEYQVGAQLPRQLTLDMLDPGGQVYSVPFDRAGTWSVESPPGTYTISPIQKGLGNWKWKLTGGTVRFDKAKNCWVVVIGANEPMFLGITLY